MSFHLQRELDQLKKEILQLGSRVESATNNAMLALNDGRVELTGKIFSDEKLINEEEVLIEENCLKILALHQPVAVDLRFIVVVLKVNNDLERMGDLAVNVASRAVFLASQEPIPWPKDFTETLPGVIRTMVRHSLDALVKMDVTMAREVIAMDDIVDNINREMYVATRKLIEGDISTVERAISLLSTSRYLERIADLATNIAEEVLFMVDGEVVRHEQ